MIGKEVSLFARPGAFSYGALEKALSVVFNADGEHQGAFRSRIKHLQRLGLPGLKAGKGARVEYSVEHASQWLLALLLSAGGIDPAYAVEQIRDHWEKFRPWFRRAQDREAHGRDGHVYLVVRVPGLLKEPIIGFGRRE